MKKIAKWVLNRKEIDMRETLFRGKTQEGEWVEGSLILAKKYCCVLQEEEEKFSLMNYPYLDGDLGTIDGSATPVIPETVGQYTGLTDKNGKKIFVGDIVQYTDEEGYYPEEQFEFVGKIVFVHGAYGIATNDNIPIDLDYWCDNDNFVSLWELYWNLSVEGKMLDMLEVIGNIHDNPELLEKE